jgi:hypothetical protein
MTTYRLFPSTNGPSAANSYSGNFIVGIMFSVAQGGMWFNGYYVWCCNTGQATTGPECALWATVGPATGTLVPGSVVTGGTLTAGTWNFIPLPTPIPLVVGYEYRSAVGINGSFPITNNSFGSGDPYSAGIINGPLTAWADQGASLESPWDSNQCPFSTAGSDPSTNFPTQQSNSLNGWMDVQVSDTGPSGYSGSYRLWPGTIMSDPNVYVDTAANYDVATEIRLSEACIVDNIWFYSPPGSAGLPTSWDIWSVNSGGLTGTLTATNTAPSWSGAAGSGWVSCSVSGVTLPVGTYRVGVYNNASTPIAFNAKRLNYWNAGTGSYGTTGTYAGVAGITNGPLYAPNTVNASPCYSFAPTSGTPTEPGQSPFSVGPPDSFPNLYVGTNSPGGNIYQNYWIDLEVSKAPVAGAIALASTAGLTVAPLVTEVAAVNQVATAGMTVTAVPERLGTVTLTGGASLSVAASTIPAEGAALSATAGLNVAAAVKDVAQVSMTGTAGLTARVIETWAGAAALSASAAMTVTLPQDQVASAALAATAGMLVGPSPIVVPSSVALSAVTTLNVVGVRLDLGVLSMAAGASLAVVATLVPRGVVAMVAPGSLTVAGTRTQFGDPAMVAGTSLTVAATSFRPVITGQVNLAAAAALTAVASTYTPVTVSGQASLAASTSLIVAATSYPFTDVTGDVVLVGATSLTVLATVIPLVPPLAYHIAAAAGLDPVLLGASGYNDNVFTTRLVSGTE